MQRSFQKIHGQIKGNQSRLFSCAGQKADNLMGNYAARAYYGAI